MLFIVPLVSARLHSSTDRLSPPTKGTCRIIVIYNVIEVLIMPYAIKRYLLYLIILLSLLRDDAFSRLLKVI